MKMTRDELLKWAKRQTQWTENEALNPHNPDIAESERIDVLSWEDFVSIIYDITEGRIEIEEDGRMKKCEACNNHIEKYDRVIRTEDGEVYHEGCCVTYSMGYHVYVDGESAGATDHQAMEAWILLDEDEYKDEYKEV